MSEVLFRDGEAALKACGHYVSLQEWHKYLGDDFNGVGGRRKKPSIAFTCPQCMNPITATAFLQLCDEPTARRFRAMMSTVPSKTCHPKTLGDFNYVFNEKGQLTTRDGAFSYHYVSETHYVWLGMLIQKEIERLMVERFGLVEHRLPAQNSNTGGPTTSIFASPDVAQREHLTLLIQGSGAVRAGQWSRALCLNEGLEIGSILPYLEQAKQRNWGVVVFNPNNCSEFIPDDVALAGLDPSRYWFNPSKAVKIPGKTRSIPGHEAPEKHVICVYDEFVARAACRSINIVAHSFGGVCTMALLNARPHILKKLRAIAFTDSVHSAGRRDSKEAMDFLKSNAVNWVRSPKPLDTPEPSREGTRCVSAGHADHEWTSGTSIASVFAFLDGKQ